MTKTYEVTRKIKILDNKKNELDTAFVDFVINEITIDPENVNQDSIKSNLETVFGPGKYVMKSIMGNPATREVTIIIESYPILNQPITLDHKQYQANVNRLIINTLNYEDHVDLGIPGLQLGPIIVE